MKCIALWGEPEQMTDVNVAPKRLAIIHRLSRIHTYSNMSTVGVHADAWGWEHVNCMLGNSPDRRLCYIL